MFFWKLPPPKKSASLSVIFRQWNCLLWRSKPDPNIELWKTNNWSQLLDLFRLRAAQHSAFINRSYSFLLYKIKFCTHIATQPFDLYIHTVWSGPSKVSIGEGGKISSGENYCFFCNFFSSHFLFLNFSYVFVLLGIFGMTLLYVSTNRGWHRWHTSHIQLFLWIYCQNLKSGTDNFHQKIVRIQ